MGTAPAAPPDRLGLHWRKVQWHFCRAFDDRLTLSLMALLILCADFGNIAVRDGISRFTVMWPGDGILLGFLLISPRHRMPALLFTGLCSFMLWNWLAGQPVWIYLGAPLGKVAAIGWAGWLLRRQLGHAKDLTRPGMLLQATLVAVVVAPILPALVVAAVRTGLQGPAVLTVFAAGYLANGIGVAVATPLVLALYREELREQFSHERIGATCVSFGVLIAATGAAFSQQVLPALFITFPPLLLVIARHGFAGACLAVPVMTVIGTLFSINGFGPIMMVSDGRFMQGLVLQVFVMTVAATAYSMGVIIAERRRLDLALIVRETRARFAEAKLRHSEELYRHMSEHASDIVSRFDLAGRRLYVSRSACEILGWSLEQLMQGGWTERIHAEDRAAFMAAGEKMRCGQDRIVSTYRYQRADGSWAWIEARLRLIRDRNGEPKEYISNARDISLQKETEQALDKAMVELSVLATTDGLTGLANRRRFDEVLRREWRRAMRSGEPLALLMIDADNFKAYNDRYGHHQGDACLRSIATTIAGSIRRPGDLAARYGGEEFALILPATTLEGARELAHRVRSTIESLGQPHSGNRCGLVTVSIGCAALAPRRDSLTTDLIEAADAALYAAKSQGRNCVAAGTTADVAARPPPHDIADMAIPRLRVAT